MSFKKRSRGRTFKSGLPAGREPLSYDRFRLSCVRPAELRSILTRTGWYGAFRQKLLLDLIDFAWCRRARVDADIVLPSQPWPMRLRERVHPFHPKPMRHRGVWGRDRSRAASRRGIRRRPNVHRRQTEPSTS